MALNVGDLFVSIRTNMSEFRRGLQQAQGEAQSAGSKIGDAFKTGFGIAAGIAGFQGLTEAIRGAGSAGIQFNAKMEQAEIAFTTMLGSAEKAKDMVADLQKFAASTPFEFPQLQDAATKMLAFGFAAQDVIPMLTAVGDAAAALGKGPEAIDRITLALGQMQAKGKVSGDEMLQLVENGVNAWKYLSDATGKTTAEVQKLSEKGLLPANLAINAIIKGMEKDFPNMMEKQSQSFNGLMSTLRDNLTTVYGQVMRPIFDYLTKEALPKLVKLTSDFVTVAKDNGLKNAFKTIIDSKTVDMISSFFTIIQKGFKFIADNIDVVISAIKAMAMAWVAMQAAAILSFNNIGRGLTTLGSWITSTKGKIGLLAVAFAVLEQAASANIFGIGDKLKAFGSYLLNWAATMANGIKAAFHGALVWVAQKVQSTIDAINTVGRGITGDNVIKTSFNPFISAQEDAMKEARAKTKQYQDAYIKDFNDFVGQLGDWKTPVVPVDVDTADSYAKVGDEINTLKVDFDNWNLASVKTGESLKDVAAAADDASKKGKKGAKDTREEWEKTADGLKTALDVIKAQFELSMIKLGENAPEAKKLNNELYYLRLEYEKQKDVVEQARQGYEDMLTTKGKNAKETAEAARAYASEAKELADMSKRINEIQLDMQRQSALTDDAKEALEILKAEHDKAIAQLSAEATKVDELKVQQAQLNEELEAQQFLVSNLTREYEAVKAAKGADSEETRKSYMELIKAQTEEATLQKEIRNTNKAFHEQAESMRELAGQVKELSARYDEAIAKQTTELAKAHEEYQRKVSDVNDKLIEDEKRVTEAFDRELDNRAKSLYNFVGLFDEIKPKDVSGEQLLGNLRNQVGAFDDWQSNIKTLADRGVDDGLIAELRGMGPKAGAEIAALNTLSDDQLQEYVSLWRRKSEEARQEATAQLEQQSIETQAKIAELRIKAAEQLEAYRVEWEKKNAEIRKNTEEEVKRIKESYEDIVAKSKDYGVNLVTGFAQGIRDSFPILQQALEEMASVVDTGVRQPLQIKSPSRLMMKYGGYIVEGLTNGIRSSLGGLQDVIGNMAALAPSSLSPAIAGASGGGGGTTNQYGGNTFYITVQGGNTRNQADELLRELHKRGVRFSG